MFDSTRITSAVFQAAPATISFTLTEPSVPPTCTENNIPSDFPGRPPLKCHEIIDLIKDLTLGKVLGPDSLPAEIFLKNADLWSLPLAKLFILVD